jgi:hypothetical protein
MQALSNGVLVFYLCIIAHSFLASSANPNTGEGPGTMWGTPQLFRRPVKVITDVDDTIVSSGGRKLFGAKLFGVDNQYKHGELYPGVTQFVLELAHANRFVTDVMGRFNRPSVVAHSNIRIPSNVCVLTARAKELKLIMAIKPNSKIFKAFSRCATVGGKPEWGMGDVHYGSIAEIVRANRRGWRKFKNFERMVENDAKSGDDRQYVFIGDTGDRDEDAAQRMAMKYPHKLRAVFLHHVFPVPYPQNTIGPRTINTSNRGDAESAATAGNSLAALSASTGASISPKATRRALVSVTPISDKLTATTPNDRYFNGVPLYYFRTYIGAAAKAHTANLIDTAALRRVVLQAAKDMRLHEETCVRDLRARIFKRQLHKRSQDGGSEDSRAKLKTPTWWGAKLFGVEDKTPTAAGDADEERTVAICNGSRGLMGNIRRTSSTSPARNIGTDRDARGPGAAVPRIAGRNEVIRADPPRKETGVQLRAELPRHALAANLHSKWADLRADARLCGDLLSAQFLL